ncbi:MAG: hypothetical protein M3281_03525 [Chloroflexota bacterium]|nr:hypothetical protein [Chloroflexota bacterium]
MEAPSWVRLDDIANATAARLEAKNAARERALAISRTVVRQSANSIRSTHRGEFEQAGTALAELAGTLDRLRRDLADHPDIY